MSNTTLKAQLGRAHARSAEQDRAVIARVLSDLDIEVALAPGPDGGVTLLDEAERRWATLQLATGELGQPMLLAAYERFVQEYLDEPAHARRERIAVHLHDDPTWSGRLVVAASQRTAVLAFLQAALAELSVLHPADA